MKAKRTLLTYEQFQLLNTTDKWHIDEVPPENWSKIPGLQRLNHTFAIMASGSCDPGTLNGISAVAGLDVLAYEPNPKQGEPDGNAYHYVFQKLTTGGYLMTGPFPTDAIVPHWFDAKDLDKYWAELEYL